MWAALVLQSTKIPDNISALKNGLHVLARADGAGRACGWALALLIPSYAPLASHLPQQTSKKCARDERAHLDGEVKVVADPPLQLLHVLAHPLHGLVRAVHAQLQLRLLLRKLLLNRILVQHLK